MRNKTQNPAISALEETVMNIVGTGLGMLPNDISSMIDAGLIRCGSKYDIFYRFTHKRDCYVLNDWDSKPENDFPCFVDRPYPLSERSTRKEPKYGWLGLLGSAAYYVLTGDSDTAYIAAGISSALIADGYLRRFNRRCERVEAKPEYDKAHNTNYTVNGARVFEVPHIHNCPGTLILELPYQALKNVFNAFFGKMNY